MHGKHSCRVKAILGGIEIEKYGLWIRFIAQKGGRCMAYVLDGYCGVYCGACPAMLSTKSGELEEDRQCYGCKSEKPTEFCKTCGIKGCAKSKGFEFCIQCNQLTTCDLLLKFISDKQYPYGQCVLKNMELIQAIGLPGWLEIQCKRWSCENCGTPHSWYHETCPQCGQAVANYQSDLGIGTLYQKKRLLENETEKGEK
jgi:hypothetical protein